MRTFGARTTDEVLDTKKRVSQLRHELAQGTQGDRWSRQATFESMTSPRSGGCHPPPTRSDPPSPGRRFQERPAEHDGRERCLPQGRSHRQSKEDGALQIPTLSKFCTGVLDQVAQGRLPEATPDAMRYTNPAESLAISTFESAKSLVSSFDGHERYDTDDRAGVVSVPSNGVAAAAEGSRHDGEAILVHDSGLDGQATYVRIRPESIDQVDIKGNLDGPGSRVIVTHIDRETGQGYYLRYSGQDWLVAG